MILLGLNDTEGSIVLSILKNNAPKCRVVAFGSRVSGGFKPSSDLDLLIETRDPSSSVQIISNLKELFELSDLKFRVDLVDKNNISKEFEDVIFKNCIVLLD